MTIEEVRRLCPEVIDTTEDTQDLPALRLRVFGSLVLVIADAAGLDRRQPATGRIATVLVVGGRLATPEGIKTGSTLRQMRQAYRGPKFVMCGSRPYLVSFRSRPGTYFHFAPLASCPEGRESPDAPVPDTTRVAAINIYWPID
jgi:hypothetical protein